MADEENIEMRDLDSENVPEEVPEGRETSFGDDLEQRPNPNGSIQIIDTSVPNIRRDVGTFKRAYTQDKKDFLRENLGIVLNKTDGPSSTTLFDKIELTMSSDLKRVKGMKYKGTKIVVYKDGRIDYSSAKANERLVDEFKDLAEKVELEHKRTVDSIVEDQIETADDSLIRDVVHGSLENLEDYSDNEIDKIAEQAKELKLPNNILREVRGVMKGGAFDQNAGEKVEDQLKAMEDDRRHWLKLSEEQGDERLKKFYENVADIEEIQKDIIRLNVGLKPDTDIATKILENEIETGDLSRFEKFKEWTGKNLGAISGVVIGLGGIIAAIVVSTRSFVRKGAREAKSFGKGLAKVAEKVGPLISAVLGLVATTLDLTAKGLSFLANNLWILVIFLFGILYKKYKK